VFWIIYWYKLWIERGHHERNVSNKINIVTKGWVIMSRMKNEIQVRSYKKVATMIEKSKQRTNKPTFLFLMTGILFFLFVFFIACNLEAEKNTDEKFDDAGHRIFSKAESLTFLERFGPFTRLSDGSIFTTGHNTCCISTDDGLTWTEYPMFDSNEFAMYCPVSVQTRKGTIIVGFSNTWEEGSESALNWNYTTHCYDPNAKRPTYVIYSKDYGKTWSKPLKLHDGWTGYNRAILETEDGHIVYSTMVMRNNLGRYCVLTHVSFDDGATWTASNVLDNPSSAGDHSGLMEGNIIQLNDGRLWMLIRTNWDYFYESYSTDNGLTWSAYTKTNIDASAAPGTLLRLQSGRIVLVWNRLYHKGKSEIIRVGGDCNLTDVAASWQRDELSLMYSDDDGKTWSSPIIIAENITPTANLFTNGIAYPCVFEQSKGVIWITTIPDFGGLKIAVRESDL
jgi:Neuraminidase (sialidase)